VAGLLTKQPLTANSPQPFHENFRGRKLRFVEKRSFGEIVFAPFSLFRPAGIFLAQREFFLAQREFFFTF